MKYLYPLPFHLTSLLQEGHSLAAIDDTSPAHPFLLQGVSTEHHIKLVRFGIWSQYMVDKSDQFENTSDVLKSELKIFLKSGYGLREDFQVQYCKYPHSH